MRFGAASSALALALTVPLGATAPSYAEPERPELPAQASDRAEQALATAQAVLAGRDESNEPSTALRELFLLQDELEGEDRERAAQVLARPDGQSPGSDWDYAWRPRDETRPLCNARVCVHYVTSGEHAATYRQAKATLAAMARSWRVEMGVLGYRAPRKDGHRGNRRWADSRGKLDVYLADLSGMGAFGYAVPEPDPSATSDGRVSTATGYLVLDQDFAGYGPRPAAYRKATAAHELFHLVQYGYRILGEGGRWFMESTATWVEERVYDGINDNRTYLRYGQIARPRDSVLLTNGGAEYGNWLLHEYYTERKGSLVVLRAWNQAASGKPWNAALNAALRSVRWSWPAMYAAYAADNNFPSRFYSEGTTYEAVQAQPLARRPDGSGRPSLRPYSSVSFQFRPQASLPYATGPRLTLRVDLAPGAHHRAFVLVDYMDGRLGRYVIPVDASGAGARWLPFGRGGVRSVTLTIVNASAAGNVAAAYTASTR